MTTSTSAFNESSRTRGTTVLFVAAVGLAVASCGGGGGGSGYSPAPNAPQPQPSSPPANASYSFKSLVADHAGTSATTVDPNLINPWGIVFAGTNPVWTANNGTQTSTLYDGNGNTQSLVVKLPSPDSKNPFSPTGIVFNGNSNEFVISAGGKSGGASFIYSGEAGMIAGWSNNVDNTNAILSYSDQGGAVYKGLALANNGTADFLYASDFHNNKVDVFDAAFAKQAATDFPFLDPQLPAGYAPFGVQAIRNGSGNTWQVYVAYAQQSGPDNHDNTNGAGLGVLDVYDANGKLVKRLVSTGAQLNAPWGLTLAPKDFGSLSNMLLVGNFGDGGINAFDPASGAFVGTLADGTGAAFSVAGLWGIAFGNDAANQPHNTLFYAAGPNDEANGDYGRIDVSSSAAVSQPPGGY
jgi:uncharacterized protein (TIGR03118 family)